MVSDPKHHARPIKVWGQAKATTLGDAKHISWRALFDGDTLAGMWEFDPDAGKVVFATFEPLSPAKKKAAAALADDVGTFLREDLGHARSFSLDTDDEMRARLADVKKIGIGSSDSAGRAHQV
jgi:hypothetical protein